MGFKPLSINLLQSLIGLMINPSKKFVKNCVANEVNAAPTIPQIGIIAKFKSIFKAAPIKLMRHRIFCRFSPKIQMFRTCPIYEYVTNHTHTRRTLTEDKYSFQIADVGGSTAAMLRKFFLCYLFRFPSCADSFADQGTVQFTFFQTHFCEHHILPPILAFYLIHILYSNTSLFLNYVANQLLMWHTRICRKNLT